MFQSKELAMSKTKMAVRFSSPLILALFVTVSVGGHSALAQNSEPTPSEELQINQRAYFKYTSRAELAKFYSARFQMAKRGLPSTPELETEITAFFRRHKLVAP